MEKMQLIQDLLASDYSRNSVLYIVLVFMSV